MPFKEVDTLPQPTVQIFFHGLLILRAARDSRSCESAIHRVAQPKHTFSVEVRAKMKGKPDVITMRHFGPLGGTDYGLTVTGPRPDKGLVTKYQRGAFDPTQPKAGDERDFRWVINFEGDLFHKGVPLTVEEKSTRPCVLLTGGDFCFHAAARTVKPIEITRVKPGPGDEPKQIEAMASIVGASLQLEDGEEAVVTWYEGKKQYSYPLQKPAAGVGYEIYLDNSPLYDEQTAGRASHSEMVEYYKVIKDKNGKDIPEDQQFDLVIPPTPALTGRGATPQPPRGSSKFDLRCCPRIPCQSVVLEP